MIFGVVYSERLAALRWLPYKDAQLQFVVELLARPEDRDIRVRAQHLSFGTINLLTADADRRNAPVIGDWHPAEVWCKRIVRTNEIADIERMINGGVEIRVIADGEGYCMFDISDRDQCIFEQCDGGFVGIL
ncbi:hypothetical protein WT57_02755 [Burkholderia pseudomultivorans]|uniref:Uncharacterized protein n=1 Tax=Burkholderia pseudomultivorans TaxID=1207504 RepID=A0A132EVX3_9BURK|nr:hypothetical protein WT57_02755 [Burkholderia pseudomultivorans]